MQDLSIANVRRLAGWVSHKAKESFSIDARALTLFRFILGSSVIIDLLLRSRNLSTFYGDGIYPLENWVWSLTDWSLHALSSSLWFQLFLFSLTAICSLCFVLGFHPRLSGLLTFILMLSLHNRNSLILNSGDLLLLCLLLLSLFLPLHGSWSITRNRGHHKTTSWATITILVQVLAVHFVSFYEKYGTSWSDGTAVIRVFNLPRLLTPLGRYFGEFEMLLGIGTYAWMVILAFTPAIVLLRGWLRSTYVYTLIASHFFLLLTMKLSVFPLVIISGLILLLPSTSTLLRLVPGPNTTKRKAISDYTPSVRNALVLILAALMVASLTNQVGFDGSQDVIATTSQTLGVTQYWGMFAPPPSYQHRYTARGTLENGSQADFINKGYSWDRQVTGKHHMFSTARWKKYMQSLTLLAEPGRREYAEYLCNTWDANHDVHAQNLSVKRVKEHWQTGNQRTRVIVEQTPCSTLRRT